MANYAEAMRIFKRVYREPEITVLAAVPAGKDVVLKIKYPDGIFYHRINIKNRGISAAYKDLETASNHTFLADA